MNSNDPVLEVAGLTLFFTDLAGARIDIISDLDFTLSRGGSLCLVGRSGSGKTSILRAVAGLASPQGGTISWWNRDISTMTEDDRRSARRRRIGYVEQAATLVGDLSALENVLLPVIPDGARAVRRHEQRARTLLRVLGLENRASHRPRTLSGGERQRVAIARALVTSPDLLIVDEPTASLDAAWAHEVIRLLAETQRSGCALLVASHDGAVAEAAAAVVRI
jgi:putative ABC transport system ATP-binding protein